MKHKIILIEITRERTKQDAKWGEQNHPSVPEDALDRADLGIRREELAKKLCDNAFAHKRGTWAHIAVEEMAEVIDAKDEAHRRMELIQLAAVCVAWIEAIDRRDFGACKTCGEREGNHGTGHLFMP